MRNTEFNLTGCTVRELEAGRSQSINGSGDHLSLEVRYEVRGIPNATGLLLTIRTSDYPVTSDFLALEAVRRNTPASLYGLSRKDISIEERISEDAAIVKVTYTTVTAAAETSSATDGGDDDDEGGDAESDVGQISFETVQQTTHITTALATVASFGNVPANPGNSINIDSQGNVAGLDITTSVLTMTETRYLSRKKFTTAYLRTVASLQNTVNTAAFRGFKPGEVRFDTISASRPLSGANARYSVSYHFSISFNEPARVIHGFRVPAKQGWDYTWFRHAPDLANVQGREGAQVVLPVIGGYVSRVYYPGNFNLLKLPSGVIS